MDVPTIMIENVPKLHESYIAMFDILGFSQMIQSNELAKVIRVLNDLDKDAEQFKDILKKKEVSDDSISYRAFQDTIIAYSKGTSLEELASLVKLSAMMLGLNFISGILLRGAITRGWLCAEPKFIIGSGIVRAHNMEQMQDWAGCWLDDACFSNLLESDVPSIKGSELLVSYKVPMKGGASEQGYVVNWPSLFKSELSPNPLEIGWSLATTEAGSNPDPGVMRKLRNIDEFLSFLESKALFPIHRLFERRLPEMNSYAFLL